VIGTLERDKIADSARQDYWRRLSIHRSSSRNSSQSRSSRLVRTLNGGTWTIPSQVMPSCEWGNGA
jgi:hypothetical protein